VSISAGLPVSSAPTRPCRALAHARLPAGSLPGRPCSPTSPNRPILAIEIKRGLRSGHLRLEP
jgi:hypothetical protein